MNIVPAENNKVDRYPLSFGLSLVFHFLFFLILLAYTEFSNSSNVSLNRSLATSLRFFLEKNPELVSGVQTEQTSSETSELPKPETEATETSTASLVNPFSEADTTSLKQLYSESTLNVKVKFPVGWTYIDQDVKKKLDGVTFYGDPKLFNPPPYVHLEVVEKYLFNLARFSQKLKTSKCEYYFNSPEELEGTFSQIIYIKTETKEDFIIKLIVKGKEPFYRFLPSFWGIVQSFDFGSSIF